QATRKNTSSVIFAPFICDDLRLSHLAVLTRDLGPDAPGVDRGTARDVWTTRSQKTNPHADVASGRAIRSVGDSISVASWACIFPGAPWANCAHRSRLGTCRVAYIDWRAARLPWPGNFCRARMVGLLRSGADGVLFIARFTLSEVSLA